MILKGDSAIARFGETSTTDEVLAGIDLKGKRVLVTGVSAGLGVEAARSLAAHGAQVVGTARDLKKTEAATEAVGRAAAANGGTFEVVAVDLASLNSVRVCAGELLKNGQPFDVIIANAGVMAAPFGRTEDGFETQFGTNHLGHFVLVNRIASLLQAPGRLINLSSAGHRFANVDLQDPNFERDALRSLGCLRPLKNGEHPLCDRVRRPASRARDLCARRCGAPILSANTYAHRKERVVCVD